MKVYFVGAGPGDPDLITVKGERLLRQAGVVVYAGSLVNPQLLELLPDGASVYNSAGMTLEEVVAVLAQGVAAGRVVVRLHTGDPSLYGAINEQLHALAALDIACEIVPGVSSMAAAAAAVMREYTVPEGSQTLIITRMGERTPVPAAEALTELARHGSSMCIFLSVHRLERVVAELLAGGYPPLTPAAVVSWASWPQQQVISGVLTDITSKVAEAGIQRTALILVGQFLEPPASRSLLYHPDFTHGYRGE